MKNCFLILTLSLIFLGCKKDRLTDEKEFLIGKWNWTYTYHPYGWCSSQQGEETLTPLSEGDNYVIEFMRKGKLQFWKNGELTDEKRIVFSYFNASAGTTLFQIDLDNDPLDILIGGGATSNIWLKQFPFVGEDGCEYYQSYFVKE